MAIITDRIADIKAKLDLYEEATRLLGPPRRIEGGVARWCCPWHDEKTPSFGVNLQGPHEGRWRCWGACAEGGDVLDFLTKMGNTTLRYELEKLGGGAVTKHFTPPPKPKTAEIPQPEVTLLPAPDTTQNHPALNRLPDWYAHRGWNPDLAEMTGLEFVVDGRGNPRIRFPFRRFSPDSEPVFYQDRAMFSTMSPKWMAPRGAIPCPFEAWRMRLAQQTRTLVICEGLPDVMALLHVDANLPVIGIPGAGAFKAQWVRVFRGISHVVVVSDNDKAGEKMRLAVAAALDPVMLPKDVHQLYVPENYKDVDEWRQSAPDSFPLAFANVLAQTMERDGAERERESIMGRMGAGRWGARNIPPGTRDFYSGVSPLGGPSSSSVGGVGPTPRRLDLVRCEAEDRQVVDVTEHCSLR